MKYVFEPIEEHDSEFVKYHKLYTRFIAINYPDHYHINKPTFIDVYEDYIAATASGVEGAYLIRKRALDQYHFEVLPQAV